MFSTPELPSQSRRLTGHPGNECRWAKRAGCAPGWPIQGVRVDAEIHDADDFVNFYTQ